MRNLTKISIALMVLFIATTALAVSAERGNFVILGRLVEGGEEGELIEEKIALWATPGSNDMLQAQLKSGTEVMVLDKVELDAGTFYIVATFGERGGITGWVSEDYVYKITKESPEPQN